MRGVRGEVWTGRRSKRKRGERKKKFYWEILLCLENKKHYPRFRRLCGFCLS